MFTRLYSFLSKYQILYQYQSGFREKHSTVQAIIEITDDIKEQLDKGNIVLGTYLDLSKAFDTVNHKILFRKLNYYGIRGIVYNCFESYLTGRQQTTYVKFNGQYSSKSHISTGVPQGSVLGHCCF